MDKMIVDEWLKYADSALRKKTKGMNPDEMPVLRIR